MRTRPFTAFLGLIAFTAASTIPASDLAKRNGPAWPYGVIGDSWGSGVAYNDDVLYDQNLDHCLRTKESHGPQMEADTSWTGDFSSSLRDAACSGSRLVDLASPIEGGYQIGNVGNPDVVVMTSGGNNCDFGTVVDMCIYHSDPTRNYGPAYVDDHDQTGACSLALDDASRTISNTLQQDLIRTINDVLNAPNVKSNPDFLLYLTGYAQFFGTDYDAWCDTEAWNIPGISPTPYLSVELRTAFNSRISQVNQLFQATVQQYFSQQVRYVDLDTGFSGHRFCESLANHADQFNTDTSFDGVYLWNLNWPWQVVDSLASNADEDSGNLTTQEMQQLFGGQGVTAWSSSGSGSGSSGNDPSHGWRLRPFHPRQSGYTAIKNAILAQLKADGLPKAETQPASSIAPAPSSTTSNLPAPITTDYCNTAYRIVLDEFNIKGVDFNETEFQGGDGLKEQIGGCGELTDWKFNGSLIDPTFKWEATGHLPIGTRDCIQRAITSAGGPDHDYCSGTS